LTCPWRATPDVHAADGAGFREDHGAPGGTPRVREVADAQAAHIRQATRRRGRAIGGPKPPRARPRPRGPQRCGKAGSVYLAHMLSMLAPASRPGRFPNQAVAKTRAASRMPTAD